MRFCTIKHNRRTIIVTELQLGLLEASLKDASNKPYPSPVPITGVLLCLIVWNRKLWFHWKLLIFTVLQKFITFLLIKIEPWGLNHFKALVEALIPIIEKLLLITPKLKFHVSNTTPTFFPSSRDPNLASLTPKYQIK